MDGRDSEPVPEQRRPSRADSLRLTRMPQIPRVGRAATGAYPVLDAPPTAASEPPLPATPESPVAPDPSRATNRRWGLIAAALAVTAAVPAGLIAAGLPDRGRPADVIPAAGVPLDPGEDARLDPGRPAGALSDASEPAPGPVTVSSAASVVPSSSPSAPAVTPESAAAPTPVGKPNRAGANLALRGSVSASDSEGDPWLPRFACDGDPRSRWSSGFTDAQWLEVDLHERWQLSQIVLTWEHAHAVAYRVETSADGESWQRVYATAAGRGGQVTISLVDNVARYVRMTGIKRSNQYGYSLYEVEIR